jgi:hypothetical protein
MGGEPDLPQCIEMFQQRDAAAVADVMRVHGQQEDAAFR